METKFSDGNVAFVDMDKHLDDKKFYESLKRKRNKANAKGRVRRMQTIVACVNDKTVIKQIIHYQFFK